MRIGITFHTFDPYLSGVDYYTLGLIRSLLQFTGLTIVVFTNAADLLQHHIPASANLIIRATPTLRYRISRIFWEHTILPQLARQERLDLLHCPCYMCPLLSTSVPCVATVHDTIAFDYPQWCKPSNALYYNLVLRAALRRSAHIIAVSRHTAADIHRHIPDVSSKISVSSPGIDPIFNLPVNDAKCSQIKQRYQLPDRFLLVVGNLEPKKNLPAILQTYHLLRRQNFYAKLVIVGKRSWKMKSQLKKGLAPFQPEEICFTGYVARHDLPAVYQLAELFLFPSLAEGFGFPALEAMACHLPVIASNRAALAETLADAAYRVDPKNPHHIAHAVERLTNEPHLREQYIQRGRQRSQQFNWQDSTARQLKIYHEVANACA